MALTFYHQNEDPDAALTGFNLPYEQADLSTYYWRPFDEFQLNELGWQDSITLTVSHDMALFGPEFPLRQLAAMASSTGAHVFGPISPFLWVDGAKKGRKTTLCTLTAQVTLGLEGEKCSVPCLWLETSAIPSE